MKRAAARRALLVVLSLALPALAQDKPVATSTSGARLELKGVKVAGVKEKQVTLDVSWAFVNAQGLRPSEVSIIAILIGARGKEYKGTVTVPVLPGKALPTSVPVVINHEEQAAGQQDVKVDVTVTAKLPDGKRSPLKVQEAIYMKVDGLR